MVLFKTKSDQNNTSNRLDCTNHFKIFSGSMAPNPLAYLLLISLFLYDSSQGRPQDLGGGDLEFISSDLGICMSRRMAKPCALLGGFEGMLPRENFFKTLQFGAF